jgi:hypothetical protein
VAREHRGTLASRSRPGHTVFPLLLPYPATPPTNDADTGSIVEEDRETGSESLEASRDAS